MKRILLFISLFAFLQELAAQEGPEIGYKVISVISKETFTLNSGGRALLGGKSRNYLLVQLPANTKEWYYAITTCPEKVPEPTIGLAGQLVKYLTPSGLATSVMGALMTPTGSGACDIFLLTNQGDLNNFLAKNGSVRAIMSGSRENINQGAVQVREVTNGNYFLAMRNPSGLSAIKVTVEVCAIVKE